MNEYSYPHLPDHVLNVYFKGHDKCDICLIYGRVYGKEKYQRLCEEHFENKYLAEYIDITRQHIAKERAERLEEKFKKNIFKRLEKGRCPIRIRG